MSEGGSVKDEALAAIVCGEVCVRVGLCSSVRVCLLVSQSIG